MIHWPLPSMPGINLYVTARQGEITFGRSSETTLAQNASGRHLEAPPVREFACLNQLTVDQSCLPSCRSAASGATIFFESALGVRAARVLQRPVSPLELPGALPVRLEPEKAIEQMVVNSLVRVLGQFHRCRSRELITHDNKPQFIALRPSARGHRRLAFDYRFNMYRLHGRHPTAGVCRPQPISTIDARSDCDVADAKRESIPRNANSRIIE